jgi:lipopolysaccharide/colanic/teichoic acid biosynthesis glycosyltransferase
MDSGVTAVERVLTCMVSGMKSRSDELFSSGSSPEDAVELNVRNGENWSLGLDLATLMRTIRVVVRTSVAW